MSKKAIVVLTRGYQELSKYHSLIQRNNSITFKDKSIDFIIFHEGNILANHQQYISSKSPHLKIIFIDISEKAFKCEKNNIPFYPPSKRFLLNYRHMCHFWFVDFWKYTEQYDAIIRIDEDCTIHFSVDEIFSLLLNKSISINCLYGKWVSDEPYVTHRLNEFTRSFIKRNIGISPLIIPFKKPSGPYTNVIAFNLSKLRQNRPLQEFVSSIEKSNFIYCYRWGDLPLWGEALTYFCNKRSYFHYKKIIYYHGSHKILVDSNNNQPFEKLLF
jgi:hypothetical protein